MVFKFRMLSDENDRFVRDYEVMYDMTLLEFNRFICKDLKYDPNAMTSFFTSDSRWNRLREYTLVDMEETGREDAPLPMEGVALGQIIHKHRDRLIFLFDLFSDRAYYLELTATGQARPGTEYPRTVLSEGCAPDQFDPEAGSDESGSIFDDAMGEFSDFEGDDSYDDEY